MASPRTTVAKPVETIIKPPVRRRPATTKAKARVGSTARRDLRAVSGRVAVQGTASGLVVSLFNEQLEPALLEFVKESTHLVGCVAWVTNRKLLTLMSSRQVALVMQNERSLTSGDRGAALRAMFSRLNNGFDPDQFEGPVATSRRQWATGIPAVSAVGVQSHKGMRALMHHKFLVRVEPVGRKGVLTASAVWTGSMNFSHGGAERSLENAVIIEDPIIAGSYLREFQSVLVASKPLACSA